VSFLRGLLETAWAAPAMTAWVLVAFVKMYAVAAYLGAAARMDEGLAFVAGFLLSLVPVLGGVLAFLGAAEVWDWAWPIAAVLFLVGPLTTAVAVLAGRGRAGRIV
jgi:hypothetical protein